MKNVHNLQYVCNKNLQRLCVKEMYKAVGDQRSCHKYVMLSVGTVFRGTDEHLQLKSCHAYMFNMFTFCT